MSFRDLATLRPLRLDQPETVVVREAEPHVSDGKRSSAALRPLRAAQLSVGVGVDHALLLQHRMSVEQNLKESAKKSSNDSKQKTKTNLKNNAKENQMKDKNMKEHKNPNRLSVGHPNRPSVGHPNRPSVGHPNKETFVTTQVVDGMGLVGGGGLVGDGVSVQGMELDGDDGSEKVPPTALELTERWMQELHNFVEDLPNLLLRLRVTLGDLATRRRTILAARDKSRDEQQELLRRIAVLKNYVKASCRLIQSGVDERVLVDRMKQLLLFFNRIPASEKSDRSLLDSWNAMFDVNAVVPRTLAKDHCDTCKRPLLHNRKQSLLICTSCAKVTEHLTPIAQGTNWMKNSLASQPENKRIRSVIAKLNQFRVGAPPIPREVVLGVRHWLKSRNHVSQDAIALPTPVTAALHALGYERYVQYSAKIANLVNGFEVASLTDEQINEIVARLRAIQLVFTFLQGRVERLAFHTNFFVAAICKLKGWDSLAASFPPQRTRKILADQLQLRLWRILLHYLRIVDKTHSW